MNYPSGFKHLLNIRSYYVHSPFSNKMITFVPALEFEALLEDISRKLGAAFRIPDSSIEPGFLINFADCGHHRPQYLGRLTGENSMTELEAMSRPHILDDERMAGQKDELDRSFAAFKVQMESVIEATKNKSKQQREKKKNHRIEQKAALNDSLKRAQKYLGLSDEGAGTFDCDVVLIALDIEVWERDHRIVTEIGITSLDTRDINALNPGDDGVAWMAMLRPRHFRVKDASHLNNFEFVSGCADRFEKVFGESEWISRRDATSVVASCFRPPFSAPFRVSRGSNFSGHCESTNPDLSKQTTRNIVLVGHGIEGDIEFLRTMGYELANLPNIIEALDTSNLFKALKQEWQASSLGSVLLDLGLTGWNLHNAVRMLPSIHTDV